MSRPRPLTRKNAVVNQVKFLGLGCSFVTCVTDVLRFVHQARGRIEILLTMFRTDYANPLQVVQNIVNKISITLCVSVTNLSTLVTTALCLLATM